MIWEKFLMSGFAYTWTYLSISLLHQRPLILMIILLTHKQRRDMAPEAQMEPVNISLTYNPRFGPQKPMAVLRVFKIMVGVMSSHLPAGIMTRDSRVEGGNPWDIGWSTCQRRNTLGENRGSPDALYPIYPP